jgi:hypothetical protein
MCLKCKFKKDFKKCICKRCNFIEFVLQISEDRLKDFLKTAETLQVRGLAESCATAVTSSGATLNGRDNDMDEGDEESATIATVAGSRHSSALRRRRIRRRGDRDAGEDGTRRLESDDDEERRTTPANHRGDQKTLAVSIVISAETFS